jgi:FUS-interacting serine-arginine-rich protein 1
MSDREERDDERAETEERVRSRDDPREADRDGNGHGERDNYDSRDSRGGRGRDDEDNRVKRGSGELCPQSLLVRNISYRVTSGEIRNMMEKYGDVRDVYIPLDHHTGRSRGFAFVEFFDARDARSDFEFFFLHHVSPLRSVALERTNGRQLDGREIHVVVAKENRKSPQEMRRTHPGPPRDRSRDRRSRDRGGDRGRDRRSRDRRSRSRDRDSRRR